MPGEGTESAYFGLARYPNIYRASAANSKIITVTKTKLGGGIEPDPSPIAAPDDVVVVDSKGWSSWHGYCKTQYAHRHGLDHFMHCHLALIKLLDYAQEIGILDHVHDDGGFWESRSADVLVANLRESDRIVAAFVGALHDQIGEAIEEAGYVSVAPIKSAPDFEHLEAEGKAILGERGELSPRVGAGVISGLQSVDAVVGEPILAWPAIDRKNRWPSLAATIEAMQRLNPELGLRIVSDRHGISYLRHGLSSRDVFKLIMPYRAPDDLTTAITELNDRRRRIVLDNEWAYLDPTRIERTATGSLLIRPCSSAVRAAKLGLGGALADLFGTEMGDKAFPGWCLLPESDGEEFFEFEWSYWPDGFEATAATRPDGTYRKNRAYWAVLPGGFVGIRDRYDISRSDFEKRCLKAVAMGVPWCALIDQEARDLSVFRRNGVESVYDVEAWSLRELPGLKWKNSWLSGIAKTL
jgi:hypothetical protein